VIGGLDEDFTEKGRKGEPQRELKRRGKAAWCSLRPAWPPPPPGDQRQLMLVTKINTPSLPTKLPFLLDFTFLVY
jgi:hypothetical protein